MPRAVAAGAPPALTWPAWNPLQAVTTSRAAARHGMETTMGMVTSSAAGGRRSARGNACRPRSLPGRGRSGLGRYRCQQELDTGAGDVGIVGLGARQDGKAALLDDGGALPGAGLGELGHLGRGVALGAEAFGA